MDLAVCVCLAVGAALLGYVLALYLSNLRQQRVLAEAYVPVGDYDLLADELRAEREEFERARAASGDQLAKLLAERAFHEKEQAVLRKQLQDQVAVRERFQVEATRNFELVAQRLLEEKGSKLIAQQHTSLEHLLSPLALRLGEFQQQIDTKFVRETEEKASLAAQLEQLHLLNQQLSADAKLLTRALKGDSKVQGDWGELQLERLLQSAGLAKDTHYTTQGSFRSGEGKTVRPDCIVHLPDDRKLVVDSKVSLTAFERFCADPEAEGAGEHLRAHTLSLRAHVKGLGRKSYERLYQINCPDYVLLFVPIEPAFALACQHDPKLFEDALRANVVIVSPSTLLATMRTVAYIWRQEDQRANAEQIAALGGRLYDKFVSFVDEMRGIKTHLDRADAAYDTAIRHLSDGSKSGATLIGQAERLRELGAPARKRLDTEPLNQVGP